MNDQPAKSANQTARQPDLSAPTENPAANAHPPSSIRLPVDDYKTLLESFAQATWETDAQGLVVADSPSWRAYTGQTREQWLGEGWVTAIHPDDRPYALHQWQQAVAQQRPVNAEFRLRSPDGGWRWTNVRAAAIRDAEGAVQRWVGLNIDISERKRAEEQLTRIQIQQWEADLKGSQNQLRATLDSSMDLIQVFEAVRDEQDEIIDFIWLLNNHTAEKIYGDVVGKSLLHYQPGVVDAGLFATFNEVIQTGKPQQYEKYYVHQPLNGWFYQSVVKLGDGVATTTIDITGRKQAEEALRQSEEKYRQLAAHLDEQVQQRTQQLETSVHDLKRSNDNLQQFAYVASHDLQEPLRKIQSFGALLQGQYQTGLGSEGSDMIERMMMAAGRMSILIRDLLSYSRIRTQQQAFDPVSLETVLQQVLITLEDAIDRSGAHLAIAPLPVVNGDESQLGQLFQNLLANALKFAQPGASPRVSLTASIIERGELPPGGSPGSPTQRFHRIEVQDEGIGFEMKHAAHIFEVFKRLHRKDQYAGTGIGLAICAKVVANHGGLIEASSQPGQGAFFRVYLPA